MSNSSKPRVVVRRIGQQKVSPPLPAKRRPGQKVGLTMQQVLDAAKKTLGTPPGNMTIKAVATVLGVAHNAISSRLKRDATTLERALAHDFLFRISRPMGPRESWKAYLKALFADALVECEAHPGLARCVALWIAQEPALCPEFTEGVLHAFGSAGLSASQAAEQFDVVVALLSGVLAVRFPELEFNPAAWDGRVAQSLKTIEPRRCPNLNLGAEQLIAIASSKSKVVATSKANASARLFAMQMATLCTRHIEALLTSGKVRPKGHT